MTSEELKDDHIRGEILAGQEEEAGKEEEEGENDDLLLMEKCPRFRNCSIAKCPLDEDMDLRAELPEDDICPLRRSVERLRKGRVKVKLSPNLKSLVSIVPAKNILKPKTNIISSRGG